MAACRAASYRTRADAPDCANSSRTPRSTARAPSSRTPFATARSTTPSRAVPTRPTYDLRAHPPPRNARRLGRKRTYARRASTSRTRTTDAPDYAPSFVPNSLRDRTRAETFPTFPTRPTRPTCPPPPPPCVAFPRLALPKSSARRCTTRARRVVQRRVLVRMTLGATRRSFSARRVDTLSVGSSKSGGAAFKGQRDRPPVTPDHVLRRCSLPRRARSRCLTRRRRKPGDLVFQTRLAS